MKMQSVPTVTQAAYARRLREVHPKYEILFRIGIETGLRVSDILAIKAGKVKPEMKIKEKKTGKPRLIYLPPALMSDVTTYITTQRLEKSHALIYSRPWNKHKPLSRIQAYRIMRREATEMGLKSIGTHSMRKTYAKTLYAATGEINTVQRTLNHKHPETTLRYLIPDLEALIAAELQKLTP